MQALHPMLKQAKGASVVIMSSVTGGPTTLDVSCPYSISKGAVAALLDTMLPCLSCSSCVGQHLADPAGIFFDLGTAYAQLLTHEHVCSGVGPTGKIPGMRVG